MKRTLVVVLVVPVLLLCVSATPKSVSVTVIGADGGDPRWAVVEEAVAGAVLSTSLAGQQPGQVDDAVRGKPQVNQPDPGQDLPKIYFLANSLFDGEPLRRALCPQLTNTDVKPDWIEEKTKRRAEFQAYWDKEGSQYLRVALNEVRQPFPYREMQAYLTVCPRGSMSHPLLISVWHFLSDSPDPWPTWRFAEIVYQELMRHYAMAIHAKSPSYLRKKYSSDPSVSLNYLHVMALEKLALLKLGKEAELKYLDQRYRTQAPPIKRAWEIVNDIEGYEAFITELKTVAKSAVQQQQ